MARERLGLTVPFVVDRLDDVAGRAYAAWPARIVAIGIDGRIVLASSHRIDVKEVAEALEWLE